MKRLVMIILFVSVLGIAGTYGQTVNGVLFDEIDVEYVQIVGYSKMLSNKVTINLDFGQETKFIQRQKEVMLKDAEGKNVEFNSMIDALNFMSKNGYEFVNAYAITVSNQNIYHYVLRKKKD